MKHYLGNLVQLLLSPGNGWEDISHTSPRPETVARAGFFPLIAIAGLSVLFPCIYHGGVAVWSLFLNAILTFTMYFLAYFIGTFALAMFLGRCVEGKVDMARCQMFVLYTVGLLATITIVVNCLPMTAILLFFLPFYVAIIMWKATRYLNVSAEKTPRFMLIAVAGVLIPPYAIWLLFSFLIS